MPNLPANYTGIYCPACDLAQTPARVVRKLGGSRQEGMLVQCPQCQRVYNYSALMEKNPRMDQLPAMEQQPKGTVIQSIWVYPEVMEALRQKFPQNLQTTLCSLLTAVADKDTVVIEGEYAREMAGLGIKRGREVLALAKEIRELREQVTVMKLERQTLQQFFGALGMAMPGPAQSPIQQSQAQPTMQLDSITQPQPPPLSPPHPAFTHMATDENGMLVEFANGDQSDLGNGFGSGAPSRIPAPPQQFSFPQGAAPTPSAVPGFVTGNLRRQG